ncbi:hypothetical protein IC229_33875 [Spirosoma sp. BT702]|uniref:Uncharacterized protein n=1 Tax=Spirosoma profusum TaxID=2771354 RepID=A0A927AWG4_9BACT|nr:hypothetical protein [Spirosoma profusum]MBD2705646.1 hypothetical protein [Spirosoma profusum]
MGGLEAVVRAPGPGIGVGLWIDRQLDGSRVGAAVGSRVGVGVGTSIGRTYIEHIQVAIPHQRPPVGRLPAQMRAVGDVVAHAEADGVARADRERTQGRVAGGLVGHQRQNRWPGVDRQLDRPRVGAAVGGRVGISVGPGVGRAQVEHIQVAVPHQRPPIGGLPAQMGPVGDVIAHAEADGVARTDRQR